MLINPRALTQEQFDDISFTWRIAPLFWIKDNNDEEG
jgi:hypothetical protein